jgi:muramoyltetrapeptide carboxypeptidase
VRSPEALEAGLTWLAAQGWQPRCATHLSARVGYLGGSDAERLSDLLELVRDPEVEAVFVARGGYGLARLLARVDPRELRRARKLVVGYSDATSLLVYLQRRAGLAAVHGPMLERADLAPGARERLAALLRGQPEGHAPLHGRCLKPGRAQGPLVGGNLRVLAAGLGTPWEVDTRGAILFLEEIGEQPYSIDRSLTQLREAGLLAQVAGVAVGRLVDCESERYPEVSASDAVREILCAAVAGPVIDELPFGHVADNRALGVGVAAELDGARGVLTPLEPVVEVAP